MNEHTLRLLEFARVRAAVAAECSGDRTRRLAEAAAPLSAPEAVARELGRVAGLHALLTSGRSFPDLDLPDTEQALPVLKKEGTVLDGEALTALARSIHSCGQLKRFLTGEDMAEDVRREAADMPVPSPLAAAIFKIYDREGEVQYKNVPVLRQIRDTVARLRERIRKQAAAYLNDPALAGYFQTDTATIKDGRTVLPLKVKHKARLKGIVHEVSGRGATLFLEPEEIVSLNNELVMQENQFLSELTRIRRELTAQARAHHADLARMSETAAYFDLLLAKARCGHRLRAVPALPAQGEIILREARHPLLGPGAVPISLSLSPEEHVLLITGPNTGGKTVTLKTVGLLALMNQFGLEVPAAEGTALPVFDNIFADIGDEQSLEQSLSTFQAHVKNMAYIAGAATARSLVLLDELGAGTDPQEGTAIAMALLDHFVEMRIKTLATTHHGVLKNYGFLKKGVVNASVEFDVERLRPTYHLIMGVPGESHALTIARRAGVADTIINRAERYLEDERTDIGRLVEELVSEKKKLIERGEAQKEKERAALDTLRRAELRELALRQRERELREKGVGALEQFLADSRRDLERIVKEIREGAHEEAVREGRALMERLEERIRREKTTIAGLEESLPREAPAELAEGVTVRVRSTGARGVVVREAKDGQWVVAVGAVRLTLPASDLETLPDLEEKVTVEFRPVHNAPPPAYELNVRGFRYADAMRALEKQMDAVLVAGVREFTVLHGKGTGALRTGIHEYLAACPHVADFHFARPEHGGAGKTVVVMK